MMQLAVAVLDVAYKLCVLCSPALTAQTTSLARPRSPPPQITTTPAGQKLAHYINEKLSMFKFRLLSHRQKCWSLVGWNRVTWPAIVCLYRVTDREIY